MVGARVCSLLALILFADTVPALADTVSLRPSDTGSVTYSPAAGVLDASDRRLISSCVASASGAAVYSRGYAEFDLRDIGFTIASATLSLKETLDVG